MTVSEVIEEIIKVKPFISGITVSGGECMLQKGFLLELFNEGSPMIIPGFNILTHLFFILL
jgi:pyruvate-formate lyase-activating enzyme